MLDGEHTQVRPVKKTKQPFLRFPRRQIHRKESNSLVQEPMITTPEKPSSFGQQEIVFDPADSKVNSTSPWSPDSMSTSSPSAFTPHNISSIYANKGPSALGVKVAMGKIDETSSSAVLDTPMFSSPGSSFSSFSPSLKKDRRPSCRTDEGDDDPMSMSMQSSKDYHLTPTRQESLSSSDFQQQNRLEYCLLGRTQMPKTSPPPAEPLPPHRYRSHLTAPDYLFKRAPSNRSMASVSTRGSRRGGMMRDASRRSMVSVASSVSSSMWELDYAARMKDSSPSTQIHQQHNHMRSGMTNPVSMYLSRGHDSTNMSINSSNNSSWTMEDAEMHGFTSPARRY